jgi:D-alanyl-D-alanine carboxypeptidase (penicillin-binding protein 5/6)
LPARIAWLTSLTGAEAEVVVTMARTVVNRLPRRRLFHAAGDWLAASAALALFAFVMAAGTAQANYKPHHKRATAHRHRHYRRAHGAPYHALLLEDADTGKILYDYNGGIQWPPASMAKMMLLLVVEEQIKAGRAHLDDPVTVSANAASTGGSRLGLLRAGEVIPLGELMKAALIRSANDAAVAVAEKVCGSTERCVALMNAQAQALGMTHTVYHTVEGLPPRPLHDVDSTDAYDLARLARALIHRTNLLQWSGMETASFDDGLVMLHNTNHLVGHFDGCDGLKTGFTIKAGFNLTATARRGNMRLIAVVLGAPNNAQRFAQAARLMDWGFDNFEKVTVLKQGELLPVQVRVGTAEVMQPVAQRTLTVIVPRKDSSAIKIDYAVPASLYGPLVSDQAVGQVIVRNGGDVLAKCAAICPFPVGQQPAAVHAMNAAGAPDLNAQGATTQVEAPTR